MKTVNTEKILNKALKLADRDILCLVFEDGFGTEPLYSDLIQRRLWLIDEGHSQYEQVVISIIRGDVVLKKIKIKSAYIKKIDGSREDVEF